MSALIAGHCWCPFPCIGERSLVQGSAGLDAGLGFPEFRSKKSRMDTTPAAAAFPTTHWSVVLAAGGTGTPASRHAWEKLAHAYWFPLHAHVLRRGRPAADAADLVQAFFARLLEKPVIQQAHRERGRFRTFLLASLENFLANEFDHSRALKRGGGAELMPLPDGEAGPIPEPAAPGVPTERQFDLDWAQTILSQALASLEAGFVEDGRADHFTALRPFLFTSPAPGEYDATAARLGLRPGLMPKLVARLRQRLRALVRAEIARTVSTIREVDEEMRYLVELIAES